MVSETKFYENVASLKFLAKKEVGQNFLVDASVCKRIAEALDLQEGERILEIGCGAGSLTYALANYPNDLDAIDIDEGMLLKTTEDFKEVSNVHVQYGNGAKWDYGPYDKIVGNLPYYITSLLVEQCLLGQKQAKRMVFMVQKEAATRLLSTTGSKDYGPLSVLLRLSGETKRLFGVSRNAFVPVPHVDSSVFAIETKLKDTKEAIVGTYEMALKLFLNRRKTLLNNLKGLTPKAEEILASVGLKETLRPENVTPEQYLLLWKTWKEVK